MEKVCYFECFSGASGDMLLGALLGTGINQEWFLNELDKINAIKGFFNIEISNLLKKNIAATNIEIKLTHQEEHHHRGLNHIKNIINLSNIDTKAKELAIRIFTTLAEAEAKVHNTDINNVHFHEVGAIDAIVDIVGFSILFIKLNIDKVIVSPINTGTGFVKSAHGLLPVPAPATLEIIKTFNLPINNLININSELLTPTGAAILATIKNDFGYFPGFEQIDSVSYGAGKNDFEQIANVVRLTIGKLNRQKLDTWLLETNIDDMQPEFYDFIFEKLFQAGAFEVFLTPIIMKKNRPANILTVICSEEIKNNIEKIIFEETSTFGIRSRELSRTVLNKKLKKINIENLGEVTVKIGYDDAGKILSAKPEYKDCAKLAKKHNIPIKQVYKYFLLNCLKES
ncbi:MAG: nickel pincer cofactor biosynthesis protein LarC [bacterium]